ncbi:MAG: 2-phospho-L-lactate guanylyltransferase [Thermomicrobiales bacterium]
MSGRHVGEGGEVIAVIPIRGLAGGKTRLAGAVSDEVRRTLTRHMLDRVLAAALAVPEIDRVVVISPDPATLARVAGVGPRMVSLRQDPANPGHNPALDQARRWAVGRGAAAMLVLSGDLPFLAEADVRAIAAGDTPVTLGTDHHGTGTNALRLDLADQRAARFPFRFGPGSRLAHETAAAGLGLAVTTVTIPGIAFDVDTVDDWRHFLAGGDDSAAEGPPVGDSAAGDLIVAVAEPALASGADDRWGRT